MSAQAELGRAIRKVGNAVLFPDQHGTVWLVYVTVTVGGWSGSALNVKSSRDGGRTCCNDKGASRMRDYAKGRIKDLGLAGEGKIRVNQAGCLDRCEEGPCIVVYPEAVWYTYVDRSDVDEIIEEHLKNGRIVERLRM